MPTRWERSFSEKDLRSEKYFIVWGVLRQDPEGLMRVKFYFDWSDLNRAFNSVIGNGEEADRELFGLITRISEKHNVCISFNHLSDMVAGGRIDCVLPKARWLDSLPNKLFFISHFKVDRAEMRNWLISRTGNLREMENIVSSSFLGMFEWRDPIAFANASRNPTIEAYISEIMNSPEGLATHQRGRNFSIQSARKVAIDRRLVHRNKQIIQLKQSQKIKFKESLRDQALEAYRELVERSSPHFFIKNGTILVVPSQDWVVEQVNRRPPRINECPHIFLNNHVFSRWSESLAIQNFNNRNFNSHASDFDDFGHLVGASYCEVFTCDKRVSSFVGKFRHERLRYDRQASHGEMGRKNFNAYISSMI